MTAPLINITSVSRNKIGILSGMDIVNATFSSDQDLQYWEVRADGAGVGQGDLVESSQITNNFAYLDTVQWAEQDSEQWRAAESVLLSDTDQSIQIDNEELTWGDKSYRINIYGKNMSGEWTIYE